MWLFCILLLWLVKSFSVLKLSPYKQKLMAVIYLVFPLCWAAHSCGSFNAQRRWGCWGSRIDRVSTNPAGTERRKPHRRPLKHRKKWLNRDRWFRVNFNKESTEEATEMWECVAKTSQKISVRVQVSAVCWSLYQIPTWVMANFTETQKGFKRFLANWWGADCLLDMEWKINGKSNWTQMKGFGF